MCARDKVSRLSGWKFTIHRSLSELLSGRMTFPVYSTSEIVRQLIDFLPVLKLSKLMQGPLEDLNLILVIEDRNRQTKLDRTQIFVALRHELCQ